MILETERLLLRPFEPGDAEDLFAYLRAPAVRCFTDMKLDTIDDARASVPERMNDPSGLYLAIVLKENNRVIGEIFSEPEESDPDGGDVSDTFSPCWMLNPDYQRKGYAGEAVRAYFDMLFNARGARRIYIYTEDYNTACQRLVERLGMRKEGLFREFISFIKDENGRPIYENTYEYAILKSEWRNRAL